LKPGNLTYATSQIHQLKLNSNAPAFASVHWPLTPFPSP
jgi:hypothetical protein